VLTRRLLVAFLLSLVLAMVALLLNEHGNGVQPRDPDATVDHEPPPTACCD
jgi:hypothetical protein